MSIDLSELAATTEPCPRGGEREDEAGGCGVCGADLVPNAGHPRFSRYAKEREARWLADPEAVGREHALNRQTGRAALPPLSARPAPVSVVASPAEQSVLMSQRDAAELAARRAEDARLAAKYHGWKPLVIWYAFWSALFGIGALSALASGGAGAFFVAAAISGLSAKYSHYLYNGGRHRVWFVIW